MPKRWTRSSMITSPCHINMSHRLRSDHFTDRRVEIGPAVAATHDVLEIFLQRHRVLHRILDDCAHQIAGKARCVDAAAAKVSSLRPGADADGNRLRGRERTGDGLELHLAIER